VQQSASISSNQAPEPGVATFSVNNVEVGQKPRSVYRKDPNLVVEIRQSPSSVECLPVEWDMKMTEEIDTNTRARLPRHCLATPKDIGSKARPAAKLVPWWCPKNSCWSPGSRESVFVGEPTQGAVSSGLASRIRRVGPE
jgi:hypothetical protein